MGPLRVARVLPPRGSACAEGAGDLRLLQAEERPDVEPDSGRPLRDGVDRPRRGKPAPSRFRGPGASAWSPRCRPAGGRATAPGPCVGPSRARRTRSVPARASASLRRRGAPGVHLPETSVTPSARQTHLQNRASAVDSAPRRRWSKCSATRRPRRAGQWAQQEKQQRHRIGAAGKRDRPSLAAAAAPSAQVTTAGWSRRPEAGRPGRSAAPCQSVGRRFFTRFVPPAPLRKT